MPKASFASTPCGFGFWDANKYDSAYGCEILRVIPKKIFVPGLIKLTIKPNLPQD